MLFVKTHFWPGNSFSNKSKVIRVFQSSKKNLDKCKVKFSLFFDNISINHKYFAKMDKEWNEINGKRSVKWVLYGIFKANLRAVIVPELQVCCSLATLESLELHFSFLSLLSFCPLLCYSSLYLLWHKPIIVRSIVFKHNSSRIKRRLHHRYRQILQVALASTSIVMQALKRYLMNYECPLREIYYNLKILRRGETSTR